MTFETREIEVSIQYYKTKEVMKFSGLRVQLNLFAMASEAGGQLAMRIFGLPLGIINELLAISDVASHAITKNLLQVDVGSQGSQLTRIFSGAIMHSWGDFTNQPDVNLVINASVQGAAGLTVLAPYSYKGSVPAATVMQYFAKQAGWAFKNNGVTTVLNNPAFKGSLRDQYFSCARQGNFRVVILGGTMFIYPKGKTGTPSGSNLMPIISPSDGMVGYPTFTQKGINVRSIFLPDMYPSTPFQIQGSEVAAANRTWFTHTAIHTLESQTPNGAWFTDLEAYADV